MLGSLSSGSSGPKPVISSIISETKSPSSCVFRGRRSTSTYCETSCWTCRLSSSSGTLSNAERLISSINRRCRRTLASSNLSLSNGLSWPAGAASGSRASGNTVKVMASGVVGGAPSIAGRSAPAARFAVNRPAMAATSPSTVSASASAAPQASPVGLGDAAPSTKFFIGGGILSPGLTSSSGTPRSIASRTSAESFGDGARRASPSALREIVAPKAGAEHALAEAVHDHLRLQARRPAAP